MKITLTFLILSCLLAAPVCAEDLNITIKHDQSGIADEIIKLKDFDFELQQRERDRRKRWSIEDSNDAVKVGDGYFNEGEIDDALFFYRMAIKIDRTNADAHKKFIEARKVLKDTSSARYYRAMEYDRKGMKDKAIDELVQELKEHPDNEQARIKLNEIESK